MALELGYRKIGDGNTQETIHDQDLVLLTPGTPEYIDAATEYALNYHKDISTLIKDASFFVLRELTLSYDFKDVLARYIPTSFLKSLSMGVAVRNVFRLSKYELGFDVSADGGRSAHLGEDYNTIPQPRSITFYTHLGL